MKAAEKKKFGRTSLEVTTMGVDTAPIGNQFRVVAEEGEHARSWGVSRRELRNMIVIAHPESWVAPLE